MESETKGKVILAHRRIETIELAPVKVDQGHLIEEYAAEARKAGWWVNSDISSDNVIATEGTPEISGVHERNISVSRFIPEGDEPWGTDAVMAEIGKPGLAFTFADLIKMIDYRVELLERGVRWLNAMGARFRDSAGDPCVASLYLENRRVYLPWLEDDWDGNDWFGSVGK